MFMLSDAIDTRCRTLLQLRGNFMDLLHKSERDIDALDVHICHMASTCQPAMFTALVPSNKGLHSHLAKQTYQAHIGFCSSATDGCTVSAQICV